MNRYVVLDNLDATHDGPIRISDGSKVHLRQGDADGACGPYVVFMALLVLDLADRDEVTAWGKPLGPPNLKRLITKLSQGWTTLFKEGTSLDELDAVVRGAFGRHLDTELHDEAGKTALDFIKRHVGDGHPVIVQIIGKGGLSHFVLAIGLDRGSSEGRAVDRLLVLDPGDPPSTVCPWNGVVDARAATGGRYPYTWWTAGDGPDTKVQFDGALALWRKPR